MAIIEHFVNPRLEGTINITLVDALFLSVNPSTLEPPSTQFLLKEHGQFEANGAFPSNNALSPMASLFD
jgi:hypothetical protein